MAKVITKTVRLTGEVYAVIESFEGKNFSDRFENMVRFCHQVIPEKKKKLQYLDLAVKRRSEQCRRYWGFEDELEEIVKRVQSLAKDARELRESFDGFGEIIRQDTMLTAGYISQYIKEEETVRGRERPDRK